MVPLLLHFLICGNSCSWWICRNGSKSIYRRWYFRGLYVWHRHGQRRLLTTLLPYTKTTDLQQPSSIVRAR